MLMEPAHRKAHDAYGTLKEAAAAYIEARFERVFAVRVAHDEGVAVTELHTSWLSAATGRAHRRIEIAQEEAEGRQVGDVADKGPGPAAHHRLRTVSDRQICQAGRDRGSPNRASTLLSKRVIAQILSSASVSTISPLARISAACGSRW